MAHKDSYCNILFFIPLCASLATVIILGEYRVFLLERFRKSINFMVCESSEIIASMVGE